jgi:hypothetical protein
MARLNVHDARCEALFASGLQRSDTPTAEAVAEAISRPIRQFGIRGCVSQMAQEFGDHPEAAADRMRWVRRLETQRTELSLTPGEPPGEIGQWIKHLTAAHRTFAERLANLQPRHVAAVTSWRPCIG